MGNETTTIGEISGESSRTSITWDIRRLVPSSADFFSALADGLEAPQFSPSETFRERILAAIEETSASAPPGENTLPRTVATHATPKLGSFG